MSIPTTSNDLSNIGTTSPGHILHSIFTKDSSIATESFHGNTSRTDNSALPTVSPSQKTTMTDALVPGENGVPACAYIVASDMDPCPTCSIDYCDCGGTVAPLLSSTSGSTQIFNCDYKTQPAASSPTPSLVTISQGVLSLGHPVQTIVEVTEYIDGVCTSTIGGGESCQYLNTFYSITTATATITFS